MWHDVVFAARLLRRSPVFAAAVVLTLALGVGVNTAVFSVINAFLLRPLPVRDAHRLFVIATQDSRGSALRGVSFADLQDYRLATPDVFEDIAGYSVGFLGLAAGDAAPERVLVTWVTGNYFPLLDVRPAVGRLIRDEEGGSGRTDAVVVLGYTTWHRRFGGDPSIVGTLVRVNGQPGTVVGVAPPDFRGTFAFSDSALYLPLNWHGGADLERRGARSVHAIARLRPGVSLERAQAAMGLVADRLAREHPDSNAGIGVRVLPERLARPEEDHYRTNALAARIMLALVALVMIVAAINVTTLLLARAASRRQELAIRAALGAGRGRLVRQMLTESLLLAAAGGSAGFLAGTWTAQALAKLRLPGDLPVRLDFQWDWRVLAYAVMAAAAAGLSVGLVVALHASRADPERMLRGSRGGSSGLQGGRLRGCLVATQIALSFVLLLAAGLFGRSLLEAERADLGFRPDGVLNIHMDVGQLGYTEARGRAFFDEVDRRVRSIPGAGRVSFAFTVPMGYIRVRTAVEAEGRPDDRGGVPAGRNTVSPAYFETMGIRLVGGRRFRESDGEQSRRVAIVNQRLADMLWPGEDPTGRRFRAAAPGEPWLEVVGVTETGRYHALFEDPQPFFYTPIAQAYTGLRVLQVRTSLTPEALAPPIERTIRALEPDLPLYDVQSMRQALGSGPGYFPVRAGATAVAALGLLAFALAIVGLYGVVAYLASQRTQEIGIRVALGATERDLVRLVATEGVRLAVVGLAGGLLIALACARFVEPFLFGVPARDPLTLLAVALALAAVAAAACIFPAWRAARVEPTVALRWE